LTIPNVAELFRVNKPNRLEIKTADYKVQSKFRCYILALENNLEWSI